MRKRYLRRLLSFFLVFCMLLSNFAGMGEILAHAESKSSPKGRSRGSGDEIVIGDYVYSPSQKSILLYKGNATELSIPSSLTKDGVSYPVEKIADKAFGRDGDGAQLTSLTLPEGITEIGAQAFFRNKLSSLTLPKSLKKIGASAFSLNGLASLNIPDGSLLESLGEGAFSSNALKKVNLTNSKLTAIAPSAFAHNSIMSVEFPSGLTTLGTEAFLDNKLSEIRLPDSITKQEKGVFNKNGRYVYLYSNSDAVHSEVVKGSFGALKNPVKVWMKGTDSDKGTEVLSVMQEANNPMVEAPLKTFLLKGNVIERTAPLVKGYRAEKIKITLDDNFLKNNTREKPYVISYTRVSTPPKIHGLNPLNVKVGETPDLKKGVTATDEFGADITYKIKISPEKVDTSVEGEQKVKYTVTDDAGNTVTEYRTVYIGVDPLEVEVGRGWLAKDFTYDDYRVTGFSATGREKLKTNKYLALPTFNPYSPNRTPITDVQYRAFKDKGLLSVDIPDSYDFIGIEAFASNKIKTVRFSEKLNMISKGAFQYNELTEAMLPESVTKLDAEAFMGNKIQKINLPEGLTTIADSVFRNNNIIQVSLPSKITSVGVGAFENNQISGLTLNENLTDIQKNAFKNNKISNVYFSNKLRSIGNDAFRTNELTSVVIPDSVKTIGSYAFSDNKIATYTLPNGITEIPEGMFHTNRLTAAFIPETVTKIGSNAFAYNNLKEQDIPSNVTEIGSSAFSYNYELKTISLHEGIQHIRDSAFYGTGLNMDELRLPSTTRTVGKKAFAGNAKSDLSMVIKKVVLNEGLQSIGESSFTKLFIEDLTIPSTIYTIPKHAFSNGALKELQIPDQITSIDDSAFYNNRIKTLKLPAELKKIGNNAFQSNKNLEVLNLPNKLESIGSNAFYDNRIKTLDVPESVKSIGDDAFAYNKIQSLDLKDTLESLGSQAFAYNKLKTVRVPVKIKDIPVGVFRENELTSVVIPADTTSIGYYAFDKNQLTEFSFPNTLKRIENYAFRGNKLENVRIPDSVTYIGEYAFNNNRIHTLRLSENLQSISSNCFGDNRLTSVTIPAAVSSIDRYAFSENMLNQVSFPADSKLQTISQYAFNHNNLREMTLPSTLRNLDSQSFLNNPGTELQPGKVMVFLKTPEGTFSNPNNIKDSNYHLINKGIIEIHRVLEGTNNEIAAVRYEWGDYGTTVQISPSESISYTPVDPNPISVDLNQPLVKVTIPYRYKPGFNANMLTLELKHALSSGEVDTAKPYGLKTYHIGDSMPLRILLQNTSADASVPDATLVLDLNSAVPGGHIDSISWPANISTLAKEYKLENGLVTIKINGPVDPGFVLEIPVFLRFKSNYTPNGFTIDLTERLYLTQDDVILKKSSADHPIGIRGDYTLVNYYKYSKATKQGRMDSDGYILPGEEIPVEYYYNVSSYANYSRVTNRLIIKDIIPKYTGKINGVVKSDYKAVFHPELSPGWVLSPDGESVVLDLEHREGMKGTNGSIPIRPLYFSFPGILSGSRVSNRMDFTEYPVDRRHTLNGSRSEAEAKFRGKETVYEEEPLLKGSGTTGDTLYGTSQEPGDESPNKPVIPVPLINFAKRSTCFYGDGSNVFVSDQKSRDRCPKYNYRNNYIDWYNPERRIYKTDSWMSHYENAFYDNTADRNEEFLWVNGIHLYGIGAKEVLLKDYGLDSRMKYTGIQIPGEVPSAELTLYSEDNCSGKIIYQGTVYGQRFNLTKQQSEKTKSFSVKFSGDYIVFGLGILDLTTRVYTRLRNPDEKLFNPEGADYYGRSEKNRIRSNASVECTLLYDDGKSSKITKKDETETLAILPWETRASFSKTVNDPNRTRDQNDEVIYTLSMGLSKAKEEDLKEFKCLDLLPKDVIPQEVILESGFLKNAENPRYEILENYNNTGRYAVTIQADSYNPTDEDMTWTNATFAKIHATVAVGIQSSDRVTNTAYISAKGSGVWRMDSPNSDPFFEGCKNVLSSDASFPVILGAALKGQKYVKNSTDTFWKTYSTKLKSEENFTYKLEINNSSSVAVQGVEIFDILPYNGDYRLMKNEKQKFVPRGTEIKGKALSGEIVEDKVSLQGPMTMDASLNGLFDTYYTTASTDQLKQKEPQDLIAERNLWVTEDSITDWTKVTGIYAKMKAGKSIPSKTVQGFYLPMKAPKNPNYMYDDDIAVNTFALRVGKGTFAEGNSINVKLYTDRGSIRVNKIGIGTPKGTQRYPLPGVKFRLWAVAINGYDDEANLKTIDSYKVLKDPVVVNFGSESESILTSNSDGYLVFEELKKNRDYVLEEISAPTDFVIDKKYRLITKDKFESAEVKDHIVLDIENKKIFKPSVLTEVRANLHFYKMDIDGYPIANTVFHLQSHPDSPDKVDMTATSTERGLVCFDNIPVGGSKYPYTITEIIPRGVLQPVDPFEVVVIARTGELVSTNLYGEVRNTKALLPVHVLGIFNLAEQKKSLNRLTTSSGKRLADVMIQLQDEAGSTLQVQKTNNRGMVSFEDLELNKDYYLAEPVTPDTYKAYENASTNNRVKIRIDNVGNVYINDKLSSNAYAVYPNYPLENLNRIDILKVDDEGKALAGAEFSLYEIKNPGANETRVLVEKKKTDNKGNLTFKGFGSKPGNDPNTTIFEKKTFEIEETSAPLGYLRRFEPFRFDTSDENLTYHTIDAENPRILLNVKKYINGDPKNPLMGAEFTLYEGNSSKGKELERQMTGRDGTIHFTYRLFDTSKQYFLKETHIPDGYKDPFETVIDLPGLLNRPNFRGELTYNVSNVKKVGTLVLTKVDQDTNEVLPGASFVLKDMDADAPEADRSGVTGADGTVRFTNLTIGKTYKLKETSPAPGYMLPENAEITVPVTNETTIRKSMANRKVTGELSIVKKDKLGNLLKNAEFILEREILSGYFGEPVLKKTDANGTIRFPDLRAGFTYRLRETDASQITPSVEKGAWLGYKKSNDIWMISVTASPTAGDPAVISVKKVGDNTALTLPLEIQDERVDIPKVRVDVDKTFRGGENYADKPQILAALYKTDAAGKKTLVQKKEMIRDLTSQTYRLIASFEDLPYDYEDTASKTWKKWTYNIEEEMVGDGASAYSSSVTADAANVGNEYVKSFHMVNTFTVPKGSVTGTKTWVNGSERPDIYLTLYRALGNGAAERVPGKEPKLLTKGALEATWTEVEKTAADGSAYIFSVKETDATGNDHTPTNYSKTENGLTVTNTYVIPNTGVVKAKKVWVDGPSTHPTVWMKLYRQVEGGQPQEVPNADLKTLPNGYTEVQWTGLDETDMSGKAYTFTVEETNAEGVAQVPQNYTKTTSFDSATGIHVLTNTYVIPKNGEATATKSWVNGPSTHPTVWFKLYRHIPGGALEEVPEADVKELPNGTTSVSWTGLDETDLSGNAYTFAVKETNAQGEDFTPQNYEKTENGLSVTNTYVIPKDGEATAKKVWVNGPSTHPVTYFKLYRKIANGQEEAVPAPDGGESLIGELTSGITEYTFRNLERTDLNGNPYIFSVKEVDVTGADSVPMNYEKEESGLTVKNTYVIPKNGEATATKVWENGPTTHPTVWMKLYRQIPNGTAQAVPRADIKEVPNGTTSVSWTGLEETDLNGNIYIFSVKETNAQGEDFTPENYTKTESGLTVTNSYVIPKIASVKAEKEWKDGDSTNRPTIYFRLYRSIEGGQAEVVPNANILELTGGKTEAEWTNLDKTDIHGNLYTFSVRETDVNGDVSFVPENYRKTESGLKVTNQYVIPKNAEATATKSWVKGPATHPTVWMKLYRQIPGGNAEEVPGAEIKELPSGTTSVTWQGLDKTDIKGNVYIFSVRETNAQGDVSFVPTNYTKEEDGLNVTNTYVIPKNGVATATKKWVNGPSDRPTVWLKLYRNIPKGAVEEVPGAEIKELPNGTTSVTWTGLDETDIDGNVYTFSVKETNAQGDTSFVPTNYTKTEEGLTVTNTYVIPKNGTATATKIWVNGPSTHPTIWLRLKRMIPGGDAEVVPGAELKPLPTEMTSVTWTGLEETDLNGNIYSFTVEETDVNGKPLVLENYSSKVEGLKVTNTYVIPKNGKATATKVWVNGPSAHPTVWFKLYRQIEGGLEEAVPEAEIKELKNGTTSVTWTGLDETDLQARRYTFLVKETDADGNTTFAPTNYTKTEEGLTVTNTYVIPKNGTATATKTWVNGPAKHPEIWMKLYRQIEGGTEEAVPEAEIMSLPDGTTSVTWSGLDETDIDGNVYTFSVKETNANGDLSFSPTNYEKAENGLRVTNSYVIPKNGKATATKVWVNGPAEHPTIWFKLYRKINGGAEEEVPGVEIKSLPNGTTSVSWTGLEETDINGNVYTFSVRETDQDGASAKPENYAKTENGLTVVNSYVIPKLAEVKAQKVWVNGSSNRPTVYFKLYRSTKVSTEEEVPNEKLRKLSDGADSVRWLNLDATDINGNEYTYTVKEVNAQGDSFVPDHYKKIENGLTVTNTYQAPDDGNVNATKIWIQGPSEHPTVWFKLYRKTATGEVEEVPNAEIKELKNGTTEVEWTGLDETDAKGNRYVFSVKEVDKNGNSYVPQNYEKTETGLTVTNAYRIPKNGTAEAHKIWVGGSSLRPIIWMKLYRKTASGRVEAVPNAEIKMLRSGETTLKWTGLEETTADGEAYTFFVKETNANGFERTPENYQSKAEGLKVTNTYVIPNTAEVVATKTWVNGPATHPTVWLKLYREIKGGKPEAVPGAELKELKSGIAEVKWTGLEKTDAKGNIYTFSVEETNEKGEAFTPENYVSKAEGLKVTNTYVIPKTAEAVATKTWVNGPATHPTVWLKLYREIKGGKPEAVPGAELKELKNGITEAKWTGLEKTDAKGNIYTFSVEETNEKGEAFTPENYVSKAEGLKVTNTYVISKTAEAVATKTWVNGPATHPTVWLKLYREIKGGKPEAVPGAELKELKNGITEVKWTGLEKTDAKGNMYTFSVEETNKKGEAFTPENYVSKAEGLKVTNTYVIPTKATATAKKIWVGGPESKPVIYFMLYRRAEGEKEWTAVPKAELKKLKNGTTEVSWTDLEETDKNGQPYEFSVREVNAKGKSYVPMYYEKKEEGLRVTNTWNKPNVQPGGGSNTGDTLPLIPILTMTAALSGILLLVLKRRKEEEA